MHHLSAATYLLYDRFMLPLRAEGFRVKGLGYRNLLYVAPSLRRSMRCEARRACA